MQESEIEKQLIKVVENAGGVCFKFVSPGNRGVPDRIAIYPGGKIHFIELKTKVGGLSALQKMQISRLRDLETDVFVLRGIEGVSIYEGLINGI